VRQLENKVMDNGILFERGQYILSPCNNSRRKWRSFKQLYSEKYCLL